MAVITDAEIARRVNNERVAGSRCFDVAVRMQFAGDRQPKHYQYLVSADSAAHAHKLAFEYGLRFTRAEWLVVQSCAEIAE